MSKPHNPHADQPNTESTQEASNLSSRLRSTMTAFNEHRHAEYPDNFASAHTIIHDRFGIKIRFFSASTPNTTLPPIIICFALINRPYILDITQASSLIAQLTALGHNVYLIDWGYPTRADLQLSLSDYIQHELHRCVQTVTRQEPHTKPIMLGVCQGGVMTLLYNALFPKSCAAIITLVTPIDFHHPHFALAANAAHHQLPPHANLTGKALAQAFNQLAPLGLGPYKHRLDQLPSDSQPRIELFLRMEQWINDNPDVTAAAFKEMQAQLFQDNALIKNAFKIDTQTINLGQIETPILNLIAAKDHIVPPQSSAALQQLVVNAPYQEITINAGHIGVMISQRAQKQVIDGIKAFLAANRV